MKKAFLFLLASMLSGCASTSELTGLPPCERIPILEKKIETYEYSRNQSGVDSGDPGQDGATQREIDSWKQWDSRVKDAQEQLERAKEECASGSTP